jgi:hypothetical protein
LISGVVVPEEEALIGVFYNADGEGGTGLARVEMTGPAAQELTPLSGLFSGSPPIPYTGDQEAPVWLTPDGTAVVYVRVLGGRRDIVRYDLDTGSQDILMKGVSNVGATWPGAQSNGPAYLVTNVADDPADEQVPNNDALRALDIVSGEVFDLGFTSRLLTQIPNRLDIREEFLLYRFYDSEPPFSQIYEQSLQDYTIVQGIGRFDFEPGESSVVAPKDAYRFWVNNEGTALFTYTHEYDVEYASLSGVTALSLGVHGTLSVGPPDATFNDKKIVLLTDVMPHATRCGDCFLAYRSNDTERITLDVIEVCPDSESDTP